MIAILGQIVQLNCLDRPKGKKGGVGGSLLIITSSTVGCGLARRGADRGPVARVNLVRPWS